MSYTIRHIAEIAGGRLEGPGDGLIQHLLLDSRRLVFPATSLFFALRGPRREGSAYIAELYKRGVRNFVVEEGVPSGELPGASVVRVKDALSALQRLAAWHRGQFRKPVIAITGSNGKTIVKEWLNELLGADFSTVRSPKSYNSQTGVPLSVWQLAPGHDVAIIEAGISRRGEMEKLEAVIRPTIGIFTNIGEAHSEGFASRGEKMREKLTLFRNADVVICNEAVREQILDWRDGPGAGDRGSGNPGEGNGGPGNREGENRRPWVFSWGRAADNSLRIEAMEVESSGTRIRVARGGGMGGEWRGVGPGGTGGELLVPFTDQASIENVLHCVSACTLLGVPFEKIAARVARLAPIAMRLELKSGINHCSIINDSYSADLSSLGIALDFLLQQQQHERRSVILSDILESGRPEAELYAEVGRALQQRGIDRLIGIGERIGANAARIGEWFGGEQVYFPSLAVFRGEIRRLHFRDETILLKGARVFEFETIDRLLTEQIHQTVMEIDLGAMADNLRAHRQLLQPETRVMAMVKAFAYGSGSFEIANLLQFHGVDYLGVAYADEGVALRKAGIRMPVMVMNTENSGFDSLAQYNLEPVLYSQELLRSLDRWLLRQGLTAFPVHLELETGLNRLGFAAEDWTELLRVLPQAPVKVMSVFSHFAASEDEDQDAYSKRQAAAYFARVAQLEAALGYGFIRHLANSAAIFRLPEYRLDMVRLGIGLYGIDSTGASNPGAGTGSPVAGGPVLREVSTLKTTIAQIKHPRKGETIGYNRRGVAAEGTVIATVRIGYADGYSRNLGNGVGKMWVKGNLAPTIGTVSMDLTMIDITGIPDVREGDEVVVFGRELSVAQLARWAGTIPYEILTGVSQRVKRVYFE